MVAQVDGKKLTASPISSIEDAQLVLDRLQAAKFTVSNHAPSRSAYSIAPAVCEDTI